MREVDEFIKFKGCQQCDGRGWICVRPFAPQWQSWVDQCVECVTAWATLNVAFAIAGKSPPDPIRKN